MAANTNTTRTAIAALDAELGETIDKWQRADREVQRLTAIIRMANDRGQAPMAVARDAAAQWEAGH